MGVSPDDKFQWKRESPLIMGFGKSQHYAQQEHVLRKTYTVSCAYFFKFDLTVCKFQR